MRIPKKYQERVSGVDYFDEDGYFLYLSKGWCFDDQGQHIIVEDTKKEIMRCLRFTEICHCEDCTKDTGYFCGESSGLSEF